MYALFINGSPRKLWNTATMLEHAMQGAESKGARTEMIHLYNVDYKGCISCFECKKIGGRSYGRCAVKDGLTPVLEKAAAADVLVLGSPVYFRTETGEMRSFLERLLFPFLTYTPELATLTPKSIRTGLIYTMNVPENDLSYNNTDKALEATRGTMERIFGNCEMVLATDTYQFKDYSKYKATRFDAQAKAKRREEIFPKECANARSMGASLVDAAQKK